MWASAISGSDIECLHPVALPRFKVSTSVKRPVGIGLNSHRGDEVLTPVTHVTLH